MVTKYKDSGNARTAVTDDADHSYEQGLGAGERNVDSATDGYQVTRNECNVTVCDGTSSVAIGAGSASDTHLLGVTILAAATPVTATIAGFTKKNNAGTEAAASIVLTGEDADEAGATDRFFDFKGAINDQAGLTVTASADEAVIVFWKAK
jgi:hypothetical protein